MNKIINFMRLIRVNNLLLLCILQYLTKYFIVEELVISSALSSTKFLYLVISTTAIAAAGYIINDLYDINIDQLNNKRNVISHGLVSIKNAWILYIILNTIGLYLGFFLAFTINQPWLSLIFLYSVISLWLYSKNMKKAFLIGNIQVSILASLSIMNVALFDLFPILNNANISHHTINNNIIYNLQASFIIILSYSIFSFLFTLIREIIKDVEDVEGDQKQGATTLIVRLGYKKTKWIILSLCSIVLFLILFFQYLQYSLISTKFTLNHKGEQYNNIEFWGANIESIIYTLIIEIILIIFMYKVLSAYKKQQFSFLSKLAKIIILIGILSIPIFSYFN